MENVEVKEDPKAGVEVKDASKPKLVDAEKERTKKVAKAPKGLTKEEKEVKVAFMENRNAARKAAGLPAAYSKEQIDAFKK